MENSDKALNTGAKRVYDVAPSEMFAEFMKTGWAPTPLTGITQDEVIAHCVRRRAELSAAFTGVRLVIPSGGPKQRSNDTDYLYRPHTAFAYYTGVQGVEANPDSVLVMDPADGGHNPILLSIHVLLAIHLLSIPMLKMANYGLVVALQRVKLQSVTESKFARLQSLKSF